MSQLNNALVQFFNILETNSGITFNSFTFGGSERVNPYISEDQKFMKAYEDKNDNRVYKYLYDPNLAFDFRFHQRIANIDYTSRQNKWVTILFNTDRVITRNMVMSNTFTHYDINDDGVNFVKNRKISVPINMVFLSNDIDYLYSTLEKLSFYFDRLVNFKYEQTIEYSETDIKKYDLWGLAREITPVNLDKLDTENRGSLVTQAYNFDLVYTSLDASGSSGIVREIDLDIKVLPASQTINLNIT